VNAVVQGCWQGDPLTLLRALQAIEHDHGRQRPYQNAPRTLDLDLLLIGDLCMTTTELTLPHPRMMKRAFVLIPLAELEPDLRGPGFAQGLAPWLAQVAHQQIERIAPSPLAALEAFR
jgi:2-amino-4-hydroxy-6-hydroxymethyldihydropteridine diphosphokinase